jgi:hypothetical protein
LIDGSERSEITVDSSISLAIPLSDDNVTALKVYRGTAPVEWKALIQLGDEASARVRDYSASSPETRHFLVTISDHALSLVARNLIDQDLIFGSFESKYDLEKALGVEKLRERPLDATVSAEEKASDEAIRAADEVLKRNEVEAPIFDAIERALRDGDAKTARQLLETLKERGARSPDQ